MVTNKIIVSGPRLHPIRVRQRKELETYFSQFGKIIHATMHTVMFDNCDSAAKCIQQKAHKILGKDYVVRRGRPTKSMRKKLRAALSRYELCQDMSGPSSENVFCPNESLDRSNDFEASNESAPKLQGNPPAESHLGNQALQGTTSSSSEGSVIYCETIAGECPQSYDSPGFDKPALAKGYIAAPKVYTMSKRPKLALSLDEKQKIIEAAEQNSNKSDLARQLSQQFGRPP
ncbi:hypothetical protein Ddc_15788 [Ditylenchus destructor]|nr:hypothetical protein Ddc_15788 [Ditylenchus destructor]